MLRYLFYHCFVLSTLELLLTIRNTQHWILWEFTLHKIAQVSSAPRGKRLYSDIFFFLLIFNKLQGKTNLSIYNGWSDPQKVGCFSGVVLICFTSNPLTSNILFTATPISFHFNDWYVSLVICFINNFFSKCDQILRI